MSIAGINPQPIACALFNELTENMISALSDSGFPGLKDYYLLSMENKHLVLIIYLKDYQWGILADSSNVKLGLLLSVIMPKARAAFIDTLES